MKPGTLYVVATPLGNRADLSLRALEVLKQVDQILAEDTRTSAKLLAHYGVATPVMALHEHNERRAAGALIERLKAGERLALISDAGTPLISDPGFWLVSQARQAGVCVEAIPGPCAAIAALSIAGLPAERFVFEGFLPTKPAARRSRLTELKTEQRTLVFYEAPHRIVAALDDLQAVFGGERPAVIARELTKIYESVYAGSLAALLRQFQQHPEICRGEFVVLVQGAPPQESSHAEAGKILRVLKAYLSLGQAAAAASEITGIPRSELYRMGLDESD
jgi:16S rRNA (cytidine1402-2'-O)-methyltransferase